MIREPHVVLIERLHVLGVNPRTWELVEDLARALGREDVEPRVGIPGPGMVHLDSAIRRLDEALTP